MGDRHAGPKGSAPMVTEGPQKKSQKSAGKVVHPTGGD